MTEKEILLYHFCATARNEWAEKSHYFSQNYSCQLFKNSWRLSCSKLVLSVTEHLVEVVDKLSTTAVVFFRSERILKCKHLYGV